MITVGDVPNNPSTGLPWVYSYTQTLVTFSSLGAETSPIGNKQSGFYSETKTDTAKGFGTGNLLLRSYTPGRFSESKTDTAKGFGTGNLLVRTYTPGRFSFVYNDIIRGYGDGNIKINSYVNLGYGYTTVNFITPVSVSPSTPVLIPQGTNWNAGQVYIVDGSTAREYPSNVPVTYWS